MRSRNALTSLFVGCTLAAVLGGCASPASDLPPRRLREVQREEVGVIVGVRDVMIDPNSGLEMPKVGVPVPSPLGILRVPVRVPGGARGTVPGEELAVQLEEGGTIMIVQERNDPPFAVGERVRVLHERESLVTGISKTRIEREE